MKRLSGVCLPDEPEVRNTKKIINITSTKFALVSPHNIFDVTENDDSQSNFCDKTHKTSMCIKKIFVQFVDSTVALFFQELHQEKFVDVQRAFCSFVLFRAEL